MNRISISTEGEKTKAVYRSGDVFAKVHAIRLPLGFGEIGWRMTGSHCDADGKAIVIANGHKIHAEPHLVKIASNSAEDVSERFNAGLEHVALRVFTAVAHEAFTPPAR